MLTSTIDYSIIQYAVKRLALNKTILERNKMKPIRAIIKTKSKGVIIPRQILEEAHINSNDALDIDYLEDTQTIIIKKTIKRAVRSGWNEAFKEFSAKSANEEMLIPDIFEDEDLCNETI